MRANLFDTQKEDVERISRAEDLPNFSEPGTGKTITTLAAFERFKFNKGLIVCPPIAAIMWRDNIIDELGASVHLIKDGSVSPNRGVDFWVVTYGIMNSIHDELMKIEPDGLVFDESQWLKTPGTNRTIQAFGKNYDGIGGLYSTARQTWLLSGTPIERYADDIWSQLRATHPPALQRYGVLTLEDFRQQFVIRDLRMRGSQLREVTVGNQNTALLNRMLRKEIGVVMRTMDEVEKNMPPVTFREVTVRMKVDAELREALRGITETKIRQMLKDEDEHLARIRRLIGLAKISDMVDYIKSITAHRPAIVGFWHTDVGKALYDRLNRGKYAANYMDGATSMDARERMRLRLNGGLLDCLIAQIGTLSGAMNMQTLARHVIFAEDDWSPSKIEQFYKRVWRLGQLNHVQVDFLRSDNEVDRMVKRVREEKSEGIAEIRA